MWWDPYEITNFGLYTIDFDLHSHTLAPRLGARKMCVTRGLPTDLEPRLVIIAYALRTLCWKKTSELVEGVLIC